MKIKIENLDYKELVQKISKMLKKCGENKFLVSLVMGVLMMILTIYIGTTLGNKFKLDLTQERLYSLSNGTKTLVKDLKMPVVMKLYYSKVAANKGSEGVRVFNNYYQYVREFLGEYESYAGGRIRLDVIDPRPDSDDEEDALFYGLQRFNISSTESYFFGLVVRSESGIEQVIPFFDPERQDMLEYDVTKAIYSVVHPEKKRVGLITELPMIGENLTPQMARILKMQQRETKQTWMVVQMMQEFFQVEAIKTDAEKIENFDVVMVVHPMGYSDKLNKAIEDYLFNGGKLLVLVDPHNYTEGESGGASLQDKSFSASQMIRFFTAWGINMIPTEFAGDLNLAGYGQMGIEKDATRLLPLVQCDQRCVEGVKSPITTDLKKMTLLFPGVIRKVDPQNDKIKPILTTTAQGNSYRISPYLLKVPRTIEKLFNPGTEPVMMGCQITGNFKRTYAEGKDAEIPAKEGATVVVISDVDFLYDHIAFQTTNMDTIKANDNSTLVLNALESLAGSSNLLAIRSKGHFNRPFEVIDRIEVNAKTKIDEKEKQINENIDKFTADLNKIGNMYDGNNAGLLQMEGLQRKKELAKKVADLRKELRRVRMIGRERVEFIGKILQYLNTLLVPFCILGFGLWRHQSLVSKRKSYRQGGNV